MKYLSALIVLFALTISTVKAQIKVTNLFLGPQYGLSFYEKDKSKSELGAFAGIEFNERYVIGYEYYNADIQKYEFKDTDDLWLSYHGPFVRYNFMSGNFKPYAAVMLGFGTSTPELLIDPADEGKKPVIFQPSLGADIELHKRFSAGLNIAYRNVEAGEFTSHPSNKTFQIENFSAFQITARVMVNLFNRSYE